MEKKSRSGSIRTNYILKLGSGVAILLVLLFISINFVSAQDGSLRGVVTDKITGKPIPSATVSIMKKGFNLSSTTTRSDGSYEFKSVPAYNYSLKASCANYKDAILSNVIVTTGKSKTVNFRLEPIVVQPVKDAEEVTVTENKRKPRLDALFSIAPRSKCASGQNYGGGYVGGSLGRDDIYYVPHNTEDYDKINENVFKDAMSDPVSTFSIDVDKAAYSNVRRFLNQNQQPYKDAVRIEEMINYFSYDYPQPKDEHPFSVTMEMDKCPWNEKHELVLIGLKGEELQANDIPASNLVFLIDVSGSMGSTNKLPLLKQAFKILVNNLRPVDKVAIVVYAGAAGTVLESTSGKYKEKIIGSLESLNSGGSTAGGAGIKLAYKIAKENYIQKGNNRVILATDGDFNIGASSNGEMVRLIEEKRDDGVFLSILGFGMGNYKDSKMEQLSNAGNGNYAYIDNILEAKKVFGKELWGTLYTIAKDVKIQIEFNPAKVKAYRLIGYENRLLNKEDFNNDKKDAGDIGCGHTVTALYEIVRAGSDETVLNSDPLEYQKPKLVSSKNLMTLKLRYKKPDEDVSKLIVHRIREDQISKAKPTNNFKFAASVAEFGMLLRESEHKANSTFEHALVLAKLSKGDDPDGYRTEFIKLVETAQLLAN